MFLLRAPPPPRSGQTRRLPRIPESCSLLRPRGDPRGVVRALAAAAAAHRPGWMPPDLVISTLISPHPRGHVDLECVFFRFFSCGLLFSWASRLLFFFF